MRRDQAILVEGVLRDFPRINMDCVERRQWLEVLAVSAAPMGVRVDGGKFTPVQDRFIKAIDEKFLRQLERIVAVIHAAYSQLSEQEQRVIALACFSDMPMVEVGAQIDATCRYASRVKASGFEKMRRACMDVIADVDEWREREHSELMRQVKLLKDSPRDAKKSYQ